MDNITLDAANISDQLGIYDFFNVIVSGAVFVFGVCSISECIHIFLWRDTTLAKGLAIVLIVYIAGIILQEIGSIVDRFGTKVKSKAHKRFLFDIRESDMADENKVSDQPSSNNVVEKTVEKKKYNRILDNQIILDNYRKLADQLYLESFPESILSDNRFNEENFNSFVFVAIQYYVSCAGKDKKVEKLRALFGMSRSLMVCFGIIAIFIPFVVGIKPLYNVLVARNVFFLIIIGVVSTILTFLFYYRMRRCKKYMMLIMLGNYDACRRITREPNSRKRKVIKIRVKN